MLGLRLGAHALVDDQAFEIELGDGREDQEVVVLARIDHLEDGPLPVEEPEHRVDLVRDLRQALEQLLLVHLEDAGEGRELFEQAAPLVESTHALHQQALHRARDGRRVRAHLAELEIEVALAPDQEAIHGRLAGLVAELGVAELSFFEEDRPATIARRQVQHAALAADVDRLQQIDQAHVRQRAREARRRQRVPMLQALALSALQLEVHARDDLLDVDRLGEVVLDAELEAADLALDRAIAGQEHEGDVRPIGVFAQMLDQREAVDLGQPSVRDDHVGRRQLHHRQRTFAVTARCDTITGLTEAYREDSETSLVRIYQEEVLLGQAVVPRGGTV